MSSDYIILISSDEETEQEKKISNQPIQSIDDVLNFKMEIKDEPLDIQDICLVKKEVEYPGNLFYNV